MNLINIQFHISLSDRRGKVLFEGKWEYQFDVTVNEKIIIDKIKEKKAEIISSMLISNPGSHSINLEKLGMCRQMKVSFEWNGKEIEKNINLNP